MKGKYLKMISTASEDLVKWTVLYIFGTSLLEQQFDNVYYQGPENIHGLIQ